MANPAGKNVDVGYKRPPVHSRFRKGKSGNPSGRPKSQNIGNGLAALINRPVTVTLEGAAHKVPLTEALAMSLAQRALTGNTAAAREFMKIVERVTAEQKIADEKPARVEKILISWVDPLDCNTSLQKLGVVERIDDKWRIPTWVVEAALARNRPVEINESDRQLLANSMVDREALPALLQLVDS